MGFDTSYISVDTKHVLQWLSGSVLDLLSRPSSEALCFFFSLSETLFPGCLVLVQLRKTMEKLEKHRIKQSKQYICWVL